jgi:hypothetical protein
MKNISSTFVTSLRIGGVLAVLAVTASRLHAGDPSPVPTDLTKGGQIERTTTYNLGATGLRGYIYTRPLNYFESVQGRTTTRSRQILVSHVGAKSPADGVIQVGDVILGAGGELFSDDARKSIALAIQEAEKDENKGILKLTVWRADKTAEVQLKLNVMGTYSATAPYNCRKSQRIFDAASKALAKEPLKNDLMGAISGLALLATGNPDYLPKVQELAHKMGPPYLKFAKNQPGSWNGYEDIFLCEYYLCTGDKAVLPAIKVFTMAFARGQGMYGTFGHGFSELTAEGKLHGSIPPYGPVNSAGLVANIAIVMGKKCGVQDPEVDAAIDRATHFFGYFVDKGAIPYGEHAPWPYHGSNGKTAMAAVFFNLMGNRIPQANFFARMATAGYANRQYGHTGQGFSYLWTLLGANVGGPAAAAAYFKETSWDFDLERRCDGTFVYDGGEQYGGGKTDDNTYYGKSSYYGLSPNACYVLSYSLVLKKLYITGKDANLTTFLSKQEVTQAIASGHFDLDRKNMTPQQLVEAFSDWSPVVRGWAAEELGIRPEAKAMVPGLIKMAEGNDVHIAQGAAEALGDIKDPTALPVLARLLTHEDPWLRFKAAAAIRAMGSEAKPIVPEALMAVAKTAEPLQPIAWADPIQLAQGQLAEALFGGPLVNTVKETSPKLVYPAIRAIATNADGRARARLKGYFERDLTVEDIKALAPDILRAVATKSPADQMFSNGIRMAGFKLLTKYHFKEGMEVGVEFAETQGGHGSENRTGEIMKEIVTYGKAAQPIIPRLKELITKLNEQVESGGFPSGLNPMRVSAVEEAIKSIETATTQPELLRIASTR